MAAIYEHLYKDNCSGALFLNHNGEQHRANISVNLVWAAKASLHSGEQNIAEYITRRHIPKEKKTSINELATKGRLFQEGEEGVHERTNADKTANNKINGQQWLW